MPAALPAVVPAIELTQKRTEILESPLGGIPRGALTEIAGPASSGRTSVLNSLLATATSNGEFCALIDATDAFDPVSAYASGARLRQILWVRCGGNAENALKAADIVAQAGGFGLVAIDLAGASANVSRRIPLAAWFRLRHAVENTRTALVSLGACFHASSCAMLKIDLRRKSTHWRGRLLESVELGGECIRNHRAHAVHLTISR